MKQYIRLSKIAAMPGGLPAAEPGEYKPGSGGVKGKSMPIEYTVEGFIEAPIHVGARLVVDRRVRNGVRVDGFFSTSTVTAVGPNHIETENSVYRMDILDCPDDCQASNTQGPGGAQP